MKKIFIIGGHLTPALSVADELILRNCQIFYLGRKTSYTGEKTVSVEYKESQSRDWRFLHLPAGKIPRYFTWDIIPNLMLLPVSFLVSLYYLLKYKPDVVVSFGGYMAVAPIITAKILNIPTLTHEQTMSPGLANRIIAPFCDKICVSWPINLEQYPKTKTVLTGNPLRRAIFQVQQKYDLPMDKPLLYITGGNLGSHTINQAIAPIIPQLLKSYNIIHQCGGSSIYNDEAVLNKLKSKLSRQLQKRYLITSFVDNQHIGWVLNNLQLMVSRAGANTVAEIIKFQIPSLLIPLPWAGAGEQLRQAKFLQNYNAAQMLEQNNLTPEKLLASLNQLWEKREQIKTDLAKLNDLVPDDAAVEIAQMIESIM